MTNEISWTPRLAEGVRVPRWNTNDVRLIERNFKKADVNGDGILSQNELSFILSARKPNGEEIDNDRFQRSIDTLSLTHNAGRYSYTTKYDDTSLTSATHTITTPDHSRWGGSASSNITINDEHFAMADINGDGKLSQNEVDFVVGAYDTQTGQIDADKLRQSTQSLTVSRRLDDLTGSVITYRDRDLSRIASSTTQMFFQNRVVFEETQNYDEAGNKAGETVIRQYES